MFTCTLTAGWYKSNSDYQRSAPGALSKNKTKPKPWIDPERTFFHLILPIKTHQSSDSCWLSAPRPMAFCPWSPSWPRKGFQSTQRGHVSEVWEKKLLKRALFETTVSCTIPAINKQPNLDFYYCSLIYLKENLHFHLSVCVFTTIWNRYFAYKCFQSSNSIMGRKISQKFLPRKNIHNICEGVVGGGEQRCCWESRTKRKKVCRLLQRPN